MPSRLLALCVLAALVAACDGLRSHDLEEGTYAFTSDTILRDDCAKLAAGAPLFDVELVHAGNYLRLRNGPYGMLFVGSYLSGEENFRVDGSAGNLTENIRGADCFLDQVSLHLDGQTVSPTAFQGTASFYFQAQTDACTCRVWTTYRAERK